MNNPKNSLPNGWSLKKLGEIAKIQGGFAFDSKKFQNAGLYQVIKMSNLYGSKLDLERSQSFMNSLSSREREYLLKPNEILITLTGTVGKRDYGYTFQITNEERLLLNQRVARIIANTELLNPKYVFYELNTNRFLNQFFYVAKGGTGNQANVGIEDISNIQLVLPPLPEQQKIATILGTWDAAIQTTSALLTALQKRKKGLMQQLLDTEKNEIKAGTIFQNISQKNYPNEPLLSATQDRGVILRSMLEGRVASPEGSTNGYKLVEIGDFIISLRSFEGGIEYSEYRGIISPAYTILRPKILIYRDYYKHYFKSDRFIKKLGVAVIGIRDGRQVSFDDFSVIKIPFPSLAEQTRIAVILNTADAELRQTEEYLEKLKTQKRGLMQQLLTGKVRVITT